MTPQQATEIGKRIINTMRPTPPLLEWQEVLGRLDFDHALATFHGFRDVVEEGLTIAAYLKAYNRRAAPAPDAPAQPGRCEHCLGELDDRHRPTGTGCAHCRIPDPATGRAIADAATATTRETR